MPRLRRVPRGWFGRILFCRSGAGPGCGRGSAGQSAAGLDQAFEVVGGRPGGEFEVDGFALDGVTRGDARHVLADQFLEALARLVLDDGDPGETRASQFMVQIAPVWKVTSPRVRPYRPVSRTTTFTSLPNANREADCFARVPNA